MDVHGTQTNTIQLDRDQIQSIYKKGGNTGVKGGRIGWFECKDTKALSVEFCMDNDNFSEDA